MPTPEWLKSIVKEKETREQRAAVEAQEAEELAARKQDELEDAGVQTQYYKALGSTLDRLGEKMLVAADDMRALSHGVKGGPGPADLADFLREWEADTQRWVTALRTWLPEEPKTKPTTIKNAVGTCIICGHKGPMIITPPHLPADNQRSGDWHGFCGDHEPFAEETEDTWAGYIYLEGGKHFFNGEELLVPAIVAAWSDGAAHLEEDAKAFNTDTEAIAAVSRVVWEEMGP